MNSNGGFVLYVRTLSVNSSYLVAGGVETTTRRLRARLVKPSISWHDLYLLNCSTRYKYFFASLENWLTCQQNQNPFKVLKEFLLGRIAHHIDEYHHVFAFVEQLNRLHWSHHLDQCCRCSQEYVNSRSIHRVLNDLVSHATRSKKICKFYRIKCRSRFAHVWEPRSIEKCLHCTSSQVGSSPCYSHNTCVDPPPASYDWWSCSMTWLADSANRPPSPRPPRRWWRTCSTRSSWGATSLIWSPEANDKQARGEQRDEDEEEVNRKINGGH